VITREPELMSEGSCCQSLEQAGTGERRGARNEVPGEDPQVGRTYGNDGRV